MLYFDTSFLAPLFKAEVRSLDVKQFVAGSTPGQMAISHWTHVEFASVLGKNVRIGSMTAAQANVAAATFVTFVTRGCTVLDVTRRDFDTARRFLADRHSGLRSGDALHLAIASNNAATSIYSLDRTMIAAGQSLGLPMNVGFSSTI